MPLFHHIFGGGADTIKCPLKHDVQAHIPLRISHSMYQRISGYTGIINQNIQVPKFIHGGIHQPIGILWLGYISNTPNNLAPGILYLFCCFHKRLPVNIAYDNTCSLLGKKEGVGFAYSPS
ncbi:hypothetical protein ES703_112198 [subsurface metagenome]